MKAPESEIAQKRRMLSESDEGSTEDDEGLNEYLGENGFGSTKLIKNLQSTFLYMLLLLPVVIVSPFIQLLRNKFTKSKHSLMPDSVCNLLMRFYIQ